VFGEVVGDVLEALGEDCGVYLNRVSVDVLSASIPVNFPYFEWRVKVFVHRWHNGRS
jgi:hypothetical protein